MRVGFLKLPVLFFALAALSVTLVGCAYITGEAIQAPVQQAVITDVSPVQANDLIQEKRGNTGFVILDVRTPQEYTGGHILNAVNLDFNAASFKDNVGLLDKNRTYLVYCRTGARSTAASKIMGDLGFTQIYNMTGGITDWQSQGLPVVK